MGDLLERLRAVPELSAEKALAAIGGSEASYERILRVSVSSLPEQAERLRNEEGSSVRVLHALKGALAGIGALSLSEQAGKLEQQDASRAFLAEFCDALDVFTGRLSAIFTGTADKPPGKLPALMACLEEIAEAAAIYQLPIALRSLAKARAYTYGEMWDERLEQLNVLLERFDAEATTRWIEKWRSEMIG